VHLLLNAAKREKGTEYFPPLPAQNPNGERSHPFAFSAGFSND
jgi:hypothetical protein